MLAFIIRAFTATWTGLTSDEANGVFIATTGNWFDLVRYLKEDGNAPLLHTLLKLYSGVYGHSDLAIKLFSLAIAVLQIPISYIITRRFLCRLQAIQVALILIMCPTLVRWSTLIRSYSLISLLALLSTWLLMKVLAEKRWFPWVVAYGLATAMLVYGHYWGGFVAVGQTCLVVFGLFRGWFDRAQALRFVAGAVFSLLLFAPWTPVLYYQLHHDMSPWDVAPRPSIVLSEMSSWLFVCTYYTFSAFDQLCLIFSTLILFFVVLSPNTLADERYNGKFWKIVALSGYFAGLLISIKVPAIRDRYLTPFLPLFAIVYVTSFAQMLPRMPSLLRATLPVAIWLPMWIPQLVTIAINPETGTPAIVDELTNSVDRKKDLVVMSWQIIAPALTFYLPEDMKVLAYPDLARTRMNRWDGMNARLRNQEYLDELFKKITPVLLSGGRIWLIDTCHVCTRRPYTDSEALSSLPYAQCEVYRMDQIRSWLADHAQQIGINRLAPGRDFAIFLSLWKAKPLGAPAASRPWRM